MTRQTQFLLGNSNKNIIASLVVISRNNASNGVNTKYYEVFCVSHKTGKAVHISTHEEAISSIVITESLNLIIKSLPQSPDSSYAIGIHQRYGTFKAVSNQFKRSGLDKYLYNWTEAPELLRHFKQTFVRTSNVEQFQRQLESYNNTIRSYLDRLPKSEE